MGNAMSVAPGQHELLAGSRYTPTHKTGIIEEHARMAYRQLKVFASHPKRCLGLIGVVANTA